MGEKLSPIYKAMGAYINTYLLNLSPDTLVGSTFSGFMLRKADDIPVSYEISDGIEVELKLQQYIKNHPAFIKSVSRLQAKNCRYGQDAMYLFYDHMMAKKIRVSNKEYHTEITQRINLALMDNKSVYSYNSKRAISHIIKKRLVDRFDTIDGVHNLMICLKKCSFSNARINNSIASIEDLIGKYEQIYSDFEELLSSLEKNIVKRIAINIE